MLPEQQKPISLGIKTMNKPINYSKLKQETAEVADFHHKRIRREMKIEVKKESSTRPEGNYEYEQLIAEEANFNAKPMIEIAAFFIAEGRGFAPGKELSDWLRAEADVERLLRGVH
jgi:hypothetical protein